MNRALALFSIFVLATLPVRYATSATDSFTCRGFAVEAGTKREISSTDDFHVAKDVDGLAEMNMNFRFSKTSRMSLQVRALKSSQGLKVATTFLQSALDPLGQIESVFFESVRPQAPENEYRIEKHFTDLEIHLICN